jgi:hypothetical protein
MVDYKQFNIILSMIYALMSSKHMKINNGGSYFLSLLIWKIVSFFFNFRLIIVGISLLLISESHLHHNFKYMNLDQAYLYFEKKSIHGYT